MSVHYILDGYNIIKQGHFKKLKLKDGRKKLIFFLETFRPQGSRRNKVTVVFDGKKDVFFKPAPSEIEVVFTNDESADEWIKRFIERVSQPKDFVVVSDDKEIRFFIRTLGAKSLAVKEFISLAKGKRAPLVEEEKPLSSEKAGKITKELEKIWLKDI